MESKVDYYSDAGNTLQSNTQNYYNERLCNGKIFKVRNWYDDKYFYGATTQPLNKILSKMRASSKTRSGGIYDLMKQHPTKGFFIEEIEAYPCSTQRELHTRLNEYIKAACNECINRTASAAPQPATQPQPEALPPETPLRAVIFESAKSLSNETPPQPVKLLQPPARTAMPKATGQLRPYTHCSKRQHTTSLGELC